MDYPEEWNQLLRHERRKKIKFLRRENEVKNRGLKKIRNLCLLVAAVAVLAIGGKQLTRKSPEKVEFEQKVQIITLSSSRYSLGR